MVKINDIACADNDSFLAQVDRIEEEVTRLYGMSAATSTDRHGCTALQGILNNIRQRRLETNLAWAQRAEQPCGIERAAGMGG